MTARLRQRLSVGDASSARSSLSELRAEEVAVHFEGVRALENVNLALQKSEILGLIGPNGAGKTTLVNVLSGFQRPSAGRVLINGVDVTRLSPHRRAQKGLARTFQSVRPFGDLTVFENVEVAALAGTTARAEARRLTEWLLQTLGLDIQASEIASSLPYGDERRLGILRALATRPIFLLLDEPAAGLNEAESDELMTGIAKIRDEFSCGVLVIEHDMRLIMRLCDRIQVLDYGKTISEGSPDKVQRDPAVIGAYLGSREGFAARC